VDLTLAAPVSMARRPVGLRAARRVLLALGIVLLAWGSWSLVAGDHRGATDPFAFDFDVNWVAAHRLVDHQSLYDADASRAEAVHLVGPRMRFFYDSPFSSYIGPPATALVHAPLLLVDQADALALFRALAAIGMLGALALTARSLTPGSRLPAFLVGLGALPLLSATWRTLQLGQAHELVLLGLALGVWGAARRRWVATGIGLGLATALKLSPILLVLYLALHRKWRSVGWAAGTAAVLNLGAAVIGRPLELLTWLRDVAPTASEGTRHMYDQSLPAWLARVLDPGATVVQHSSLGAWHLLGIAIGVGGTVCLWRARRHRGTEPLALGALVLLVLLAGPLTWDHYAVWSLIPLVLLADTSRWARATAREVVVLLGAIGVAGALLHVTIDSAWAASFGTGAMAQITGGPTTLAIALLLGVAVVLLGVGDRPNQQLPVPDSGVTRYTAASSLSATS
jgi:hypothetical protein